MNSYLLKGRENFIDHIGCIRDLGIIYWEKDSKKMDVGDIVYLFISDKKYNRVMFRLKIVETNSVREDKLYWRVPFENDDCCFKLENTAGIYCGSGLDYDDLEKHGISRYVQRYKKLNKEQSDWLASHFE